MAKAPEVQHAERFFLGQEAGGPPAASACSQPAAASAACGCQSGCQRSRHPTPPPTLAHSLPLPALLSHPADKRKPLDPLAVSVVIIKCLAGLHHPLLGPEDCRTLLGEAFSDNSLQVKVAVITHTLQRLPAPQQTALQLLLRYLARLDRSSDKCPRTLIAPAMGPPLLRPESCGVQEGPGRLTTAAIWVVDFMIAHYERIFQDALPDEAASQKRQQHLQDKFKQLIQKKPAPPGTAKAHSTTSSGGGGRGGGSHGHQHKRQQAQQPARMVNPLSTMPGAQGQNSWMLSSRMVQAAGAGEDGVSQPWLLPPGRKAGGDEQPPGSRPLSPIAKLSAQPQEDGRAHKRRPDALLWPANTDPSLGGSGHGGTRSQGARATSLSSPGHVPSVFRRQIELKAAQKPPQVFEPPKSPWRPPGRNDKVPMVKKARTAWTPALLAFRSSGNSGDSGDSPRITARRSGAERSESSGIAAWPGKVGGGWVWPELGV